MFEVTDHFAGTSSVHATQAGALAAGRSLARELAERRGLGALLEEACSCDTLIYGTVLDDTGNTIDVEPLVWIDPSPSPPPLPLKHSSQPVVPVVSQVRLVPWTGGLMGSHA